MTLHSPRSSLSPVTQGRRSDRCGHRQGYVQGVQAEMRAQSLDHVVAPGKHQR
jgi:hypothetical protein